MLIDQRARHGSDLTQLLERAHAIPDQAHEHLVLEQRARRHVVLAGQTVAHCDQLPQHGQLPRIQCLSAAHLRVLAFDVEAVESRVFKLCALLPGPLRVFQRLQSLVDSGLDGRQVSHVVRSVAQVTGRQRSVIPMGERHPLAQVDTDQLLDQIPQRHWIGLAGEARGDLGIEDVGRRTLKSAKHRLEVLPAGVDNGLKRRVRNRLPEHGQIQVFERVDQGDSFGRGDLDEADPWVIAELSDELRVVRERANRAQMVHELVEIGRSRDERSASEGMSG